MRPVTLEIEGLQSFKENRRIDFETLGETGLFGIFGPTGSGKSTILDAITFALFGDVRRAKNGTQGIINIHCRTMRVSFTFELVKEGARKRYRVERVSQRKKDSDHATVAKIARLMELTDAGEIPICDKATDVTNKVTELIGLNQQDFTRAVVLPQNSFQEFLLMNHSDRRRMLERIFYLEEYGKLLLDKLNRKIDRVKSAVDSLSGELKGYQDASDEALEEARQAMETAAAEKEKALKAYQEMELMYNQAKEVWQLVQEMTEVEAREHRHAASAQEVGECRIRLARAEKAVMLAEPIRKNRELAERLQKTCEQLAEAERKLPAAQAEWMKYRKSYESLKKEREVEQPRLVARKARLEDALALRDEIAAIEKRQAVLSDALTRLKNVTAQKTLLLQQELEENDKLTARAAELKREWDTLTIDPEYRKHIQEGARLEDEGDRLQKTLRDLQDEAVRLKKRTGEDEIRLEQVRKAIAATQEETEALTKEKAHYDSMLEDCEGTIRKKALELQDIRGICKVLQLRRDQIKDLKSQWDRASRSLEEAGKNDQALRMARDEAAAARDQYRLRLEETEGLMDRDAACRLARRLKEGVPCPVCGSEHHPRPAEPAAMEGLSDLETRAGELRSRLEAAEKDLREAEAALLVNGEKLRTARLQHDQMKEALEAQIMEFEKERQKLPDAFKDLDPDNMAVELEKLEKELDSRQKEMSDWNETRSALSERIRKLSDTLSEQKARENGILSELRMGRESLARTEDSLEEARKMWEKNREKVSQFLAAWSISSIRSELDRLNQNDQRSSVLRRELDGINEQISRKESGIGRLKEELQAAHAEAIKYETETVHLDNERKTREIRIHNIAGDSDMDDEIRRIQDRLEAYETEERSLEEKTRLLETDYQNLQNRHAHLLDQKKTLAGDLADDNNRLNKALEDMDFRDTVEAENALMPDEEMNASRRRIEAYDREGIRIQADKERIAKKLDARTITEEGWQEISKAWQESANARENLISQCDIAAHHYQSIRIKHERWRELTLKLEEANKRLSLLEQIRKLLGGDKGKDNSFIDYIAEERLRYVAAKASETLGTMTRYKYALELDAENGFVIRDNANGGVYRMVTTLSGGETFLTSLSLALALSEQIQLKGQSPLEFFFLDEGFGTLDRDLLDNVIDSLERVSKKERVIGLISHVPELRGRIGRRLMVEPPAIHGEGTRVWIEKA